MMSHDAQVVGFQGEPGAHSEQAIGILFGEAKTVPYHSLHQVFEAVEIGAAGYGVIPIENSHAGSINDTYDLLVRHGVSIVGQAILRIRHCLLAQRGASLSEISSVYSHTQALEQCGEFLDSLGVERIAVHDTAGAARVVAETADPSKAAIASEEAAHLYGLDVLASDVEDRPDNSTKFVAVARGGTGPLGTPEKTSIVFATSDVPGALYLCLKEFADRDLNLSKLESRPSRTKAWQYHFYLDFEAPLDDERSQSALSALSAKAPFLRVLGTYPSGGSE